MEFPKDFFDPPANRPKNWPDNPELRAAANWFKTFMSQREWEERRLAAAKRLYTAALGQLEDPSGKGSLFAVGDTFGWYLFLADAFLDHVWNYDPTYGSRVVPVFQAIGRHIPLLQGVRGLDARVQRLVGPEKRQPNGGLFELLVAGAYRRAGAEVEFPPEIPGGSKTHDMNVRLDGQTWAVECKRMETGEYGERERSRMRQLWGPSSAWLMHAEKSTFCDVHFDVEIDEVPDRYLTSKVKQWLASSSPSLRWNEDISTGTVGDLSLSRLRAVLATDHVLSIGSRMLELLSGSYIRNANYVSVLKAKPPENPRYIDDCDLAVCLRWESRAPAAIDAKARDILKKLSEATEQLPHNTPGIVHIGFEAVEGDDVEKARYEKILRTVRRFDAGTKRLEYVFCHCFVPESPPDQAWAYDETTQWCAIRPELPRPLKDISLVLPPSAWRREGTHWQE
jgi:hypothetical protein